jgi:hypothetical protein
VPPPEYRNAEASKHETDLDGDLYPVPDRRGVSLNDAKRRVQKRAQNRIYDVTAEDPDFSLDKAVPQLAVAIDAQIDGDDASHNFIKKKLHSNIRC